MTIKSILALAVASVPVLNLSAADAKVTVDPAKLPPPVQKANVTYVSDIKPVFEASCVKCHSGERPKARLRLDSLEGTLKGGESGKVVKPGNSAASLLIHNIARLGDPDFYMPPPGNKANIQPLTKEQIGLIRAWIDQGAH